MPEHVNINLLNLAGGGAVERFNDALEDVIADIRDVNTDPKATRAITLKVTFKPKDEERDFGDITIDCNTTLAPAKKLKTQAWFGIDPAMGFVAVEHNPKQPGLFKQDPKAPGRVIPYDAEEREAMNDE